MRFILAGVALVFSGILTLGVLGGTYAAATVEYDEFGTCHTYSEDGPPQEADCSERVSGQALFFGLVIGLVGAGALALAKGARGDWDSRVGPGEMVGPGGKAP